MKNKVHMGGMICLKCGIGRYGGYDGGYDLSDQKNPRSQPCDNCGNQQPAFLLKSKFRQMIKQRDDAKNEGLS